MQALHWHTALCALCQQKRQTHIDHACAQSRREHKETAARVSEEQANLAAPCKSTHIAHIISTIHMSIDHRAHVIHTQSDEGHGGLRIGQELAT
eukprot:1148993-Pelagomonas_calceolata.AAC.2